VIGRVAFCVTSDPAPSGKRAVVRGVARVVVLRKLPAWSHVDGGGFRVRVVKGSGVAVGREIDMARSDLYTTGAELCYFERLVHWLFSDGTAEPPGPRPEPT
jgi:hypothetical protein